MKYCLVNGEFISRKKARLDINDVGVTRGAGMFDFLRVYDSIPLYLPNHLERLNRGMKMMGFPDVEGLDGKIRELLEVNDVTGDSGVRILVTGGKDFTLDEPQIIITQEMISPPSAESYTHGASLLLDEYQRELPEVKSTNYLRAVMLYREMVEFGASDILYHHAKIISECARSNVFLVRDGQLITSGENVLQGITRMHVLEIADTYMPVMKGLITLKDLETCDELFITSTIKRILPISKVSGIERIWKPGPVTKDLMKRLDERDTKEKQL